MRIAALYIRIKSKISGNQFILFGMFFVTEDLKGGAIASGLMH
jgi:hypothetical protein